MKIVLTGMSGFRNRGVEALADAAMTEMRELWPHARFTLITMDPAYDASRNSQDVLVLRDSPSFFKQKRMHRGMLAAVAPRSKLENVNKILNELRSAELVVASGGDIFSSDYGTGLLRRQLGLLDEAQRAGRKTVFLAHSIGPFKTDSEIALIRPVLQASSLVTVRESFTLRYLVDKVGIAPERVILTSDVAFALQPSDPQRAARISALVGLPAGAPFIALGPSEGITSFSDVQNRAAHDNAWVHTVQHFLDTTDRHIVLVPHVQDANLANDDSQIAFRVLDRMRFPARVHMAAGPFSARDYKALISGAEFFAGERMHACIAALSTLVPSLVIGYSVKARGIMNDVFEGESQDWSIVSVADFVGHPDRATLLSNAWNHRQVQRQALERRIPVIKERAALNFKLLKALCAGDV